MTKYITTKEAAKRYKGPRKRGCNTEYICRLAKRGDIPGAKRFGHQYQIPANWEMLEQEENPNG
jgi:hypothetical protein